MKQKHRISIVVLQRIAACTMLLALFAGCGKGSPLPAVPSSGAGTSVSAPAAEQPSPDTSPSQTPAPSPGAPSGVDPDKFVPAVTEYISDLSAKKTGIGDLTVKIDVSGIIGFVDITLKDTAAWSGFTEAEKKECITTLGKALDELAVSNTYPGTRKKVGTDTVLYSSEGRELAERTSLGIVKLY